VKPSDSSVEISGTDCQTDGVEAAPVSVDWWMGLLVLVAWSVVPLAVGFSRFGTADL
jgi:hypothetical protein